MFLQVGDAVEKGSVIPVIVSARLIDSSLFFVPSELAYDGPRLSDSFFDFELAIQRNNQIIGSGGAFYTQLANNGCVDGDTARFVMPDEMLPFTEERVMRTRFFNFDSPETFRGGEEEFGMPASLYACELLENASSIVLQTDPGDNLFDRFGRLLAWIWVQFDEEPFELLNYWMVRQGLGEVRYLFGAGETSVTVYDGLTYTEWMFLGEQRAKDDSLGIHGDLYDYYWDYTNNQPNPFVRP
jgi:micrococcal nuclease